MAYRGWRRLVFDEVRYLWRVLHEHDVLPVPNAPHQGRCREVLAVRVEDAATLRIGGAVWPLYGQYWVEFAADGAFTVHGVVDLDEDGELFHVSLSEGETSLRTLSED